MGRSAKSIRNAAVFAGFSAGVLFSAALVKAVRDDDWWTAAMLLVVCALTVNRARLELRHADRMAELRREYAAARMET